MVRAKIKFANDRMKTRYDLRAKSVSFQNGEKIWVYKLGRSFVVRSYRRVGRAFSVVIRINDLVYGIQKNSKIVHLNRFAPYSGNLNTDRDDQLLIPILGILFINSSSILERIVIESVVES